MTPLHYAARYGHLNIIEYLVHQKADINAKDGYNETPLHFAANYGYLSVVEYLVHQKADINAKTKVDEFLNIKIHLFILLLNLVILVLLNI